MTSPSALTTTGDLRRFLAKAIEDVAAGKLSTQQAHAVSKLANALNESFRQEIAARALGTSDLGGLALAA